jgi:hypothetical protein
VDSRLCAQWHYHNLRSAGRGGWNSQRPLLSAAPAPGILALPARIDAEYAPEPELHLVMDNYGTHKTDQVERWLKRHRRFKVHFVPTSSSWLNMVERWFAEPAKPCDAVVSPAFHI